LAARVRACARQRRRHPAASRERAARVLAGIALAPLAADGASARRRWRFRSPPMALPLAADGASVACARARNAPAGIGGGALRTSVRCSRRTRGVGGRRQRGESAVHDACVEARGASVARSAQAGCGGRQEEDRPDGAAPSTGSRASLTAALADLWPRCGHRKRAASSRRSARPSGRLPRTQCPRLSSASPISSRSSALATRSRGTASHSARRRRRGLATKRKQAAQLLHDPCGRVDSSAAAGACGRGGVRPHPADPGWAP
jgi:hypothetical protein